MNRRLGDRRNDLARDATARGARSARRVPMFGAASSARGAAGTAARCAPRRPTRRRSPPGASRGRRAKKGRRKSVEKGATERGCDIALAPGCFYRPESAQGRDLATLCAMVAAETLGRGLDALDATCASGARATRYAPALRSVVCNDADEEHVARALEENLRACGVPKTEMRFEDAHRLLARYWLEDARFDLVDVDGFGSVNFAEGALRVVRYGGYYYATSTDGRALCGQNPSGVGASFGNVVVAPSRPSVNETALRAFIGDVVRRAAVLKLDVTPVFSLFHPHGPVFRVMFRVDKAKKTSTPAKSGGGNGTASYDAFAAADANRVARMGFIGYCDSCGSTEVIRRPLVNVFGHDKPHRRRKGVDGDDSLERRLKCSVCGARDESLAVSGPIWIGPLHDAETVESMWTQADALGWLDDDDNDDDGVHTTDDVEKPSQRRRREKGQLSLRDLLDAFRGEANPRLSGVAHYFRTDELGRKGRCVRVPPRDVLITALRAEGHAATRSHIDPRGIKTNAAVNVVVDVANRAVAALDELDGR